MRRWDERYKGWRKKDRQSGFEDDPRGIPCRHPGHEPPGHMVIPAGKIYRHICPACGAEQVIQNKITFMKV